MQIGDFKRIFIALNLPSEIKDEIGLVIKQLSEGSRGVKWVDPKGLHLTLHFLGDLDTEKIEKTKESIGKFEKKFGELEFSFGRLNFFPNMNSPRVIFLEINQTNGQGVFSLQKLLGDKISRLEISVDKREWRPHITLGRIKNVNLYNLQDKIPQINKKNFKISCLELMESKLSLEGAKYFSLASYEI